MLRKLLQISHDRRIDLLQTNTIFSLLSRFEPIDESEEVRDPLLVTIDPVNRCNLKCIWCNADFVLGKNNGSISKDMLFGIIDLLKGRDVEAIAFSGGGEPLLHPSIDALIERCASYGMLIAISTNGVRIDDFIEPLSRSHWIGASIDTGSGDLMKRLKSYDYFEKVTDGIRRLIDYSTRRKMSLTEKPLGLGVMYRYLVHPENVHEIYKAAKIAKEIRCENFYFRPASISWDRLEAGAQERLDGRLMQEFEREVERAKTLEDDSFKVLGYMSIPRKEHSLCYDIFSTAICMPGSGENQFSLGLCYDRRGDESLMLGRDLKDPHDMVRLWGSKRHWKIFQSLDTSTCPGCAP